MSAHPTPGPWAVFASDPLIIINAEGASLGEMSAGDPFIERAEMEANARLAASAPALLGAANRAAVTLAYIVSCIEPDGRVELGAAETADLRGRLDDLRSVILATEASA